MTIQVRAAGAGLKILAGVLVLVVLLFVVLQVRQWRADAQAAPARIEARDATAGATTGIAADLGEASEEQHQVEVRIITDTRQLQTRLETIRRESPTVDAALAAPIPVELRELARARREARDRLGAAADGSAGADQRAAATGAGHQD